MIDLERATDIIRTNAKPYLSEWFPNASFEGNEMALGNIHGDKGDSLKFNINKMTGQDFATGETFGGPVDLYAQSNRMTIGDALKELSDKYGWGTNSNGRLPKKQPSADERIEKDGENHTNPKQDKPEITFCQPPEPLPNFPNNRGGGQLAGSWIYRDPDGAFLVAACRYEKPNGDKMVVPMQWDGKEWQQKGLPKPRPLYGLPKLAELPDDASILIVEGEKCADVAQEEIKKSVCMTWMGGSAQVKHADWSVIAGRKVLIWPDADEPGNKAAATLSDILVDLDCSVDLIDTEKLPDKYDIADLMAEGTTKPQLAAWIGARRYAYVTEPIDVTPQNEPPQGDYEGYFTGADNEPDYGFENEPPAGMEIAAHDPNKWPFRCLGYNSGTYYYMPQGTQQITALSAGAHTASNLIGLASYEWWLSMFGNQSGTKIDNIKAASALMRICEQNGVFDGQRMIRGRGVWHDDGRVVVHLGNQLWVDGEWYRPNELKTDYIYPSLHSFKMPNVPGLDVDQSKLVLDIAQEFSFENKISPYLLSGWVISALICGSLKWRPHIMITGGAGSGKSTALDQYIKPLLGRIGQDGDSSTTEAAIRQTMRADSLPVVMDETEGNDDKSFNRLQGLFELARVSSSGGVIGKGSPSGDPTRFVARMSFCFTSINPRISTDADASRITLLKLQKNTEEGAQDKYRELTARLADTFTQDYCDRLFWRSVNLIPVILDNVEAFTRAIMSIFAWSRRDSDQIGTLLACTYSLYSDNRVTSEAAEKWLAERNITGFRTQDDSDAPEHRMMAVILGSLTRVEGHNGHSSETSIGEAIILASRARSGSISGVEAEKVLARRGIKVIMAEGGANMVEFYVSANLIDQSGILTGTEFSGKRTIGQHIKTLSEEDGTTQRFPSIGPQWCFKLSIEIGEDFDE